MTSSFLDKSKGQFLVTVKAQDVVLDYGQGWPKIEGIHGDLRFEGNGMIVEAHRGSILGAQLSNTRVEIPDFDAPISTLIVKGRAEGPTSEFLKFIELSPVAARIDHFTEDMRASGNGQLDLGLVIPLDEAKLGDSKIDGTYKFVNNEVGARDRPCAPRPGGPRTTPGRRRAACTAGVGAAAERHGGRGRQPAGLRAGQRWPAGAGHRRAGAAGRRPDGRDAGCAAGGHRAEGPALHALPDGGATGQPGALRNRDSFDHHVRSVAGGPLGSVPPVKDFEFRLAAARGGVESSAELKFESPGAVALGCHIHGSMRGHVLIAPAPYQAVTDAAGRVLFPDIPNASAEIRLWHPDQLVEQPVRRVNLGGRVEQELTLNFAPRRRPTPRP